MSTADDSLSISHSGASSGRRRRRVDPGRNLIPRLLVLVVLFTALFEGKTIGILVTHKVGSSVTVSQAEGDSASSSVSGGGSGQDVSSQASGTGTSVNAASPDQGLAGLASLDVTGTAVPSSSSDGADRTQQTEAPQPQGEQIDSPAVVQEASPSVDDSYFSDAVFIGDSRMEGFRNASGITQGTFLTGVGLSINDMDKQIISTSDGTISVYQGLSGRQYSKIYLMLGTNELGFYPWEDFGPKFESVIKQFHQLQPGAVIYVCSVIYVEESKIAAGFEYDNNENVQTINKYILSTCEDLWYSYYINLNEIFSDGYHELIAGASADGIHLEPEYTEQMLDYLKSHYITDEEWETVVADNGGSLSQDETEGQTDEAEAVDAS